MLAATVTRHGSYKIPEASLRLSEASLLLLRPGSAASLIFALEAVAAFGRRIAARATCGRCRRRLSLQAVRELAVVHATGSLLEVLADPSGRLSTSRSRRRSCPDVAFEDAQDILDLQDGARQRALEIPHRSDDALEKASAHECRLLSGHAGLSKL